MVNLTFIKVISSRTYVPFSFKTCGLWTEVSLCPPCTWPHANTLEDLLQSIKPFPLKLNPHLQKTDQAWGRIILANLPGGEWGLSLCGHLRALCVFKVLWDATSPGTHFSLDHFLCMFSLRGLTTLQQDSQIHRAKLDDVRPPLLADYKLFKRKLFENLLDCIAAHLLSSLWVWKKLICSLCPSMRSVVKSQSTQCTCSLQCCAWKLCGNDPKDDLECKIG